MKAITTRYLAWTTSKPSRIRASAPGVKTLIMSVDSIPTEGTIEEAYGYVASQLAHKQGWYTPTNYLIGGENAEGDYVFVFSDSRIIASKDRYEEEL